MIFEGLNIVLISPDNWSFVSLSKHHYARELAKNNKVYFVSQNNGDKDFKVNSNLMIINDYRKIRGINRLPSAILRKGLMQKEVRSIISKLDGEIDLVWSFDTSRLYFLDLFKAKISIAHLVDFTENYFLRELVSAADICFATSDSIMLRVKKHNLQCYKIHHGFYPPQKDYYGVDLPGSQKIKGIYVGNLNIPYFHWEILETLANTFSYIDFVLVGPIDDDLQSEILTKVSANVLFVPRIEADEVQSYLEKADFCFQFYNEEMFPDQLQNPHKLMQYMGAGKPIFSSFTYEYRNNDLLFMYNNFKDVADRFRDFLEELDVLASAENVKLRKSFAENNTYAMQLNRIQNLLNER